MTAIPRLLMGAIPPEPVSEETGIWNPLFPRLFRMLVVGFIADDFCNQILIGMTNLWAAGECRSLITAVSGGTL